jgi:TPR repeat protein
MECDTERIATLARHAEDGEGAAARELGTRYRTGDGVPQDMAVAVRWLTRGADLGDREAQNDLGTTLLEGFGCEVDKARAVSWYRRSALQGCVDAQWNLGKRYLHGDGVEQDYALAYEWLSQAAARGYAEALGELGTMYWLGHGVPPSLLAAADFHLIAAEKGDRLACDNLADYRRELETMALSGSQMASLFLCRMHNRGFGARKSQPMTWGWIRWAKKHCSTDDDADIAQEVDDAYEFYRRTIVSEDRRRGERALAGLRAVQRKRANLRGC